MPITKIVPGGQTGADRGGLEAARWCGLPHGGWCPKGRLAEDGAIPATYELQEMPTDDYPSRTEANVVDSDTTAVITKGRPTRGSLLTIQLARKHGKPWIHFSIDKMTRAKMGEELATWLQAEAATTTRTTTTSRPPGDIPASVTSSTCPTRSLWRRTTPAAATAGTPVAGRQG